MNTSHLPHLITAATLSPSDRDALVAGAHALQRAEALGALPRLLEGKNIGLLCTAPESAEAALFERAASELGARVARISPELPGTLGADDRRRTARTLGRLYDAIECQGLADEWLQGIRAEAGVPVYGGAACAHHPSAALAADADQRRHVLQALLLSTIV